MSRKSRSYWILIREANQPGETRYRCRLVGKELKGKVEGGSTCTRGFQRNCFVKDGQVSTIISRRTESQILKNSWISESVTPLVPPSCRKLTENCTSRFQTKPRHQEKGDVVGRLNRSMSGFGDASNVGCETGGVFSSQKGTQLARPILRYSSTARWVQFIATTSTFLQTGLQSITSAKCWHPSTRFVKAIDSDSGNIPTRVAVALNRITVFAASEGRRCLGLSHVRRKRSWSLIPARRCAEAERLGLPWPQPRAKRGLGRGPPTFKMKFG